MKKKKINKEIDAYKYAQEFEKLSLEIVNIIYKEAFDENDIVFQNTTKKTRDKGVDAYLVLKVHDMYCTYTVESKLRTSDTLSLKDFATSILYYLLNTSLRHFVVTNVSYSKEVLRYIEQFNNNEPKSVELIDGYTLQKIINSHLEQFYDYSHELFEFLMNKALTYNNSIPQYNPDFNQKSESIIELSYYKQQYIDVVNAIENGCYNFLVTGYPGTGKSTFIRVLSEKMHSKYIIHKIDISKVQTPKLLIIELLRILLKIDIDLLFSDLASDQNVIDNILKEMQRFNPSSKILNAIKILIGNGNIQQEEYVYMLNILIQHLYQNFLIHKNTIIIIENLHEANKNMIKFVIDTAYSICCKSIILFWELLLPRTSSQLPYISINQWYGYVFLLENKKYGDNPSYLISLDTLKDCDIKKIISTYLPNITLTHMYFEAFKKNYGSISQNVFDSIKVIKGTKAYSVSAMNKLANHSSRWVENYISNLMYTQNNNSECYNFSFTFAFLQDGSINNAILCYLCEKYKINVKKILFDTGLFIIDDTGLILQKQYINILNQLIDLSTHRKCIEWLCVHLDDLHLNYIDRQYYEMCYHFILSPEKVLDKMEWAIQNFYQQQVYKYAIQLAKLLYEYYKSSDQKLLYCKFYIIYILYVQKINLFDQTDFNLLLEKANAILTDLSLFHAQDSKYWELKLNYALIKYKEAKSNYNYKECELQIEYILEYENKMEKIDIFPLARIYSALNKKEQGRRKEFIIELSQALQKYPKNKDVITAFYVNMAAMYKFVGPATDVSRAINLLKIAKKQTFNPQKCRSNLEVEIGLLNLLCYKNQLNTDQIQEIRLVTEKANSMHNLAKTFNLEAYYYLKKNDIHTAIDCLQSAIFHSLASGQGKQYFLFSLNLLTVMDPKDETCLEEFEKTFYNIFQWFEHNQKRILDRLHRNPYVHNDHMFAALISFICVLCRFEQINLIHNTKILEYFPDLIIHAKKGNTELIKQNHIPEYYILNQDIFILF